ncbi:MAG: UpxY family transcription antiterminator [Prevotellaceae bacterium]|nr:UpxY family transcription antiterminator [Candidatus Minthosoma equi]
MNWFLLKTHSASTVLSFRDKFRDAGLEVYLPTIQKVENTRYGDKVVEKPVMFSYIFMRSEEGRVVEFEQKYRPKLTAIWRKSKSKMDQKRLLVIPDKQMQMFMQTVGQYQNEVPFLQPSNDMLEKGDKVRIIGGPFEGVEGILLSQQGKDGGRILVRISDVLAVPTLEIEPQMIEVLEFAKGSHHFYQKMNSLAPRVEKAIELKRQGQLIPIELTQAINIFVKRFRNLQTSTLNSRVRFLSMLLQCYLILNLFEDAKKIKNEIEQLQPKLKSESMLTLSAEAFNIYNQLVM